MKELIEAAELNQWVSIDHVSYSHIEFSHDGNGYTFGVRKRRSGHMGYPVKGKTQFSGIKYWKTLKAAKKNAVEFLS